MAERVVNCYVTADRVVGLTRLWHGRVSSGLLRDNRQSSGSVTPLESLMLSLEIPWQPPVERGHELWPRGEEVGIRWRTRGRGMP